MGQATVDLPDPMQSPAAPATAGTDDLLAQLAGDEIERLLAETEAERPAAAVAPAAIPPANAATAALQQMPAADPSATAPLPAGALTAGAVASASAAAPDPKENLTTQLDALFESLNDAATPPPTPAAAPTPSAPVVESSVDITPAAPPAAPMTRRADPASDAASSPAELKALGEPISDTAVIAAALADTIASGADEVRPSLLVRILELINFPLGQCSDPVRQAVGRIAIATLLNAIAVLAYTLVFRHH